MAVVGVAVATTKSEGRRPLLLAEVSGLVLSILALAGSPVLAKGKDEKIVRVHGLLTYTASYQVST